MENHLFNNVSLLTILNNRTGNNGNTFLNGYQYDFLNYRDINNAYWNENSFGNIKTLNFYKVGVYQNTFTNLSSINLKYGDIRYNLFSSVDCINFNEDNVFYNTFANCDSIKFDIHDNVNNNWTTQTNVFSHVDYVEFNIDSDMNIDLRKFLGLSSSCSIGGININIHPNDCKKRVFEEQIANLTDANLDFRTKNLMSLSFNSTNDWINSGFRKTLSSWCETPGIFWNYSRNSKLNVQGPIISSTGKITDLKNKYFQPKFSPNYNSLKHYMVLYGDTFKDYFEMDPHALEAGHNNNACENMLLQQDYTFYSTLATAAGKENYTFIQWPSTEITFPKSDYSNNTLLNTISDITKYLYGFVDSGLVYMFGTNDITYTYVYYSLKSTLASKLGNTSSSSQLYAGFSYSGLLTKTQTYRTSINY